MMLSAQRTEHSADRWLAPQRALQCLKDSRDIPHSPASRLSTPDTTVTRREATGQPCRSAAQVHMAVSMSLLEVTVRSPPAPSGLANRLSANWGLRGISWLLFYDLPIAASVLASTLTVYVPNSAP